MAWNFIIYFVSFFQIFIIYKTLDLYYNRRFKFKYSVELAIVVITIILCIIKSSYSIDTNPYVYMSFYVMSIIISIFIFKGKVISKIVSFFLMIAVVGASELIAVLLIWFIVDIDLSAVNEQSSGNILAIILSQTFLIFFYMIMKKRIDKQKMNLNNNIYYAIVGSIMFFTVEIILNVIWIWGNLQSYDESINLGLVLLTLSASLLAINSIVLISKIINDMEEKHKLDLELQHIKFEQKYFSDVNSALEELRILRHDMRGELAIIHGYNELNQRDKIRNHIEKKLREMNIQFVPQIDNDNFITSFLNFKVKEAQTKGINIQIKSNIDENTKFHIDKEDMCRVLNNIMNNAIEANENCNKKYISLEMSMEYDYIFIVSENPYNKTVLKEDNKIITTKKDKTKHGYGLKSIKGIAEKYNGHFYVDYDDNVFNIEVDMMNKEFL